MSDPIDAMIDAGTARFIADIRRKRPRAPKGAAPAKGRGTPERDQQRAVVAWLRKAGCIVSATFTEQAAREKDPIKRGRFGQARKLSGATTGFPDLTVITEGGVIFFIEMKSKDGSMSVDQKDIRAKLEARGRVVILGRDVWSVQDGIKAAGISLAPLPQLRMAVPVQPLVGPMA